MFMAQVTIALSIGMPAKSLDGKDRTDCMSVESVADVGAPEGLLRSEGN